MKTIKNVGAAARVLTVDADTLDRRNVWITIKGSVTKQVQGQILVSLDQVIKAVLELGGIAQPVPDPKMLLPEVIDEGNRLVVGSSSWPKALAYKTADAILQEGLGLLALHAHLMANPPKPPVDEADIKALAALIDRVDPSRTATPIYLARLLLAFEEVKVTRD